MHFPFFLVYFVSVMPSFSHFFFLSANHSSLVSSAFSHLLDDNPLPLNEVSASELLVSFSHRHLQSGQSHVLSHRSSVAEVDRGFVTLVASDHPGIEVSSCSSCYSFANFILNAQKSNVCASGSFPCASFSF